MAAIALAQEKVWFEKPAYDKAECLHFERLAKPAQCYHLLTNTNRMGIWTNNNNNNNNDDNNATPLIIPQNQITNPNQSTKKTKKIKSPVKEIRSNQNSNKIDSINSEALEIKSEDLNKFKPKEAKEKKNKADKKHANKKEPEKLNKEQKKLNCTTLTNKEGPQYSCPIIAARGCLANEVAEIQQHIKQSLQCVDGVTGNSNQECVQRSANPTEQNQDLNNTVLALGNIVDKLADRVQMLEDRLAQFNPLMFAICPAKPPSPTPTQEKPKADKEDDDVDLFGSDSEGEDEAAAQIREQRLAAYAAKKSKKPVLIAKSNIILDVKPWDDETDMKAMETEVRKIEMDGLLWGAAKLVPLAYGIHKLQISCVVEDDKVSVDSLTEQIEAIEDFVQSVDIAAFNKV